MKTVSADYSQGIEALFGENAGKQCVAISLTVIIYHQREHISEWTSSTLNNIFTIGNNVYVSIRYFVQSMKSTQVRTADLLFCMMTQFDYNYQNPSGFAFLVLISDIVIFSPLGLQNLNKKNKNKLNPGSCSQISS